MEATSHQPAINRPQIGYRNAIPDIAVAMGNRAAASQKASLESVFHPCIFALSLLANTMEPEPCPLAALSGDRPLRIKFCDPNQLYRCNRSLQPIP
jgi:hypothetical protein